MKKKLLLFACIIFFHDMIFSQVPSYVPTSSLVSWFGFSGNANDAGPAANNGTVYGAILTTDRFNNPNSAYDFDGISNYISAGTVTAYNSDNFSISFWTRRVSDFGTNWIISVGGNNNDLWGALAGASAFRLGVGDGCLGSGTVLLFNTNVAWHMITYTQTGSVQTIYFDAVNQGTDVATVMSSVTCESDSLQIGLDKPGFAQFYTGKIDDIGIWNRVLTDCEVERLYLSGLPSFSTATSSSLICSGQSATLTAGGASNYTWTPGNLTGSNVVVSPTTTVNYTCTATSTISGCTVNATLTQNVNTCAGLSSLTLAKEDIVIFPNPSSGDFNIFSSGPAEIKIYDLIGRQVKSINLEAEQAVQINDLKSGLYIVRAGEKLFRVVKE